MINITIKTDNGEIIKMYQDKILLSSIIEDNGLYITKPCGGKGICGKCKVRAIGCLSQMSETERSSLSQDEVNSNYRLSCITYAEGDVVIYYNTTNDNIQCAVEGFEPNFVKNPITKEKSCFGVAIDVGTTTIAGYLYKFPEDKCVKTYSLENTQSRHGADVISRIEYFNNGGADELQKLVSEQIDKIVKEFNEEIDTFVITGNTTMLHLLTKLDPSGIALSPFIPNSLFGEWKDNIYLPSCISSYVGADITTAILSSNMMEDEVSFLVDIGTNGEMALWNKGRFVCCSTAAGPAFEGAGISMGTRAIDGAISKVYIDEGIVRYETINGDKPIGLCGTGLIDAIACMVELGVIDETGYLEEDYEIGDSKVYITVADVRQVQLAKSAIRAGIETLLSECSIGYHDIQKFYIAGGFGSFIDKKNSGKIGLIPNEILDKVVILGNAAGIGASMILRSGECLEKSKIIPTISEVIELSNSSIFMDKYIDYMMF